MKLLVFSDSHQDINDMSYCIESESPQMIIHLGDNTHDALLIQKMFPKVIIHRVAGNCDFEYIDNEKLIKVSNIKLFITHGHRYWVKTNYRKIVEKGLSEGADIILFGHTHKAYISQNNNVWTINPGSISNRQTRDRSASYAKITIEDDIVECEIIRR